MPDSKYYELMVKRLLATKVRTEGLGQLKAFHLKKYRGKSGQEHELTYPMKFN
jgi:hypothetical protein